MPEDPGTYGAYHYPVVSVGWWELGASNRSASQNNTSQWGIPLEGFCCCPGLFVVGIRLRPRPRQKPGHRRWNVLPVCVLHSALALDLIRGCPDIWASSLAGGLLLALGNFTSVPITEAIGLGMGFLIRSISSLPLAWASARFGLFGLDEQEAPSPTLNYIVTALTAMSALMLFSLKTEDEEVIKQEEMEEQRKRLLERHSEASHVRDHPIHDSMERDQMFTQFSKARQWQHALKLHYGT